MSSMQTEYGDKASTGLTPIQCLTLALGLAIAVGAALSWGDIHRASSLQGASARTSFFYPQSHAVEVPETVFYLVPSEEAATQAINAEATALAEHWLLTGTIPPRSTITLVAKTPEQAWALREVIEGERGAIEEAGGRVVTEYWLAR